MSVGFYRFILLFGISQFFVFHKNSVIASKIGPICTSVYAGYGFCVSINRCDRLYKVFTKVINSVTYATRVEGELLDKSRNLCKSYPSDHVCCPFDDIISESETRSELSISDDYYDKDGFFAFEYPETKKETYVKSKLPSKNECGFQLFQEKIIGGTDTRLEEYPWVALIQYYRYRSDSFSYDCGGTLISRRYVLTAAHCVTGEIILKIGSPISVRLGEYNLQTEVDCTRNKTECVQSQYLDVGIEKITPHPLYNKGYNAKSNDIALIQLIEDINFTPYIRPICLTEPYHPHPYSNTNMVVSGFGRTLKAKFSKIKQKLLLSVFDHTRCVTQFRSNLSISISKNQICAGGKFMQDTCSGDSGGALAQYKDNNWYLMGLVSFGVKCGLYNWPGVYTYVPNYVDWIVDNMQS
uniref:CSON006990 protein n=1 Tax=Culicoides sonorensis TaxID=179676 RepID=A0A336MXK1_CULSO